MMKMRAAFGDGLESEHVEALTWQDPQILHASSQRGIDLM